MADIFDSKLTPPIQFVRDFCEVFSSLGGLPATLAQTAAHRHASACSGINRLWKLRASLSALGIASESDLAELKTECADLACLAGQSAGQSLEIILLPAATEQADAMRSQALHLMQTHMPTREISETFRAEAERIVLRSSTPSPIKDKATARL